MKMKYEHLITVVISIIVVVGFTGNFFVSPQLDAVDVKNNNFYYNFTFIDSNVEIKADDIQIEITQPKRDEKKEVISLSLSESKTPEIKDCKIFRPEIREHYATKIVPVIKTGSMLPCSENFDELEVAWAYPSSDLQIGDVVYFYRVVNENENSYLFHRIINKTENGFVTKGDANEVDDLFYFSIYLMQENYGGLIVGARVK